MSIKVFIDNDYRIDKNTPVTLMGNKTNHYLNITGGTISDNQTTPFPDIVSFTGGTGGTGSAGN